MFAGIYGVCACSARGRTLDLLELELEMIVSCHMGAEIEPKSSGKVASALKSLGHLSSLYQVFLVCLFTYMLSVFSAPSTFPSPVQTSRSGFC